MKKYLPSLMLLLLTACPTGHYDAKEYPCGGPTWHNCAPPANGQCCPEHFDCGGTPEFEGCPAGACCFNGDKP